MSTNTNHYSLVKPAETDRYNINVANGNLDAIDTAIHGATQRVNDLAKGVMEVSLAGGDVTIAPTDKELIIVAAAHATHKLLLPDVVGSRFLIINKDESNKALVAASGSEAIIKIDKDSAAMVAHNSQGAYKAISGGGGGGAFDVADVGGTLQAGLSPGTCLLPDENNVWRPAQNGIVILGADGKLYTHGSLCNITGYSGEQTEYLTQKKNIYATDSGQPSNVISDYKLGYLIEDNIVSVELSNATRGETVQYIEPFGAIAAIPSNDGAWLKLKMNPNDERFKLHVSTEGAYDGSGLSWGSLVLEDTTDTQYHGADKYFKDNNNGLGYQDGQQLYYRVFNKKSGTWNIEQNENNEVSIKAGVGFAKWSGDNVSGNVVVDQFAKVGANDLTNYNCLIHEEEGALGEIIEIGGDYANLARYKCFYSAITAYIRFKPLGTGAKLMAQMEAGDGYAKGWAFRYYNQGIELRTYINDNESTAAKILFPIDVSMSEWADVFIYYERTTGICRIWKYVRSTDQINEYNGSGTIKKVEAKGSFYMGYDFTSGWGRNFKDDTIVFTGLISENDMKHIAKAVMI